MMRKTELFKKEYYSFWIMNIAMILFLIFFMYIMPVDHLRKYVIERQGTYAPTQALVYGETTICQTFVPCEDFDSFEIKIDVNNNNYHGTFQIELFDENSQLIQAWTMDKLKLEQRKHHWVSCRTRRILPGGKEYKIEVSAPSLDEENAIALVMHQRQKNTESVCLINAKETDQVIPYSVYLYQDNVFAIASIFIIWITANLWWFNRKKSFYITAFWVLLGTGLVMLLIMAPASQPDEYYHYNSALRLSNILMGEKENISSAQGEYKFDLSNHYNSNESFIRMRNDFWNTWEDDGQRYLFAFADQLVQPIGYFPQAIGIALARLLNGNFLQIYTLGRAFNLMAFIIMAMIALYLIPAKKQLLLLICIMPMTMHEAASLSRDALVNGMSLIYFAWYMKMIYSDTRFTWRQVLISIVMLGTFGTVKVIYCALALLVFLIPGDRFRNGWDKWIKAGLVTGGTVAVLLLTKRGELEYNLTASTWAGATDYYHIDVVRTHPVDFIRLIIGTMESDFLRLIKETVGINLAGLTVPIREYLVYAFFLLLFLEMLNRDKNEPEQRRGEKVYLIFLSVLGYALINAAFAFANTLYGSMKVGGIQGRYLIPFVAPLVYGLRSRRFSIQIEEYQLLYPFWIIELGFIVNVMSQITILE